MNPWQSRKEAEPLAPDPLTAAARE